MVNQLQKKWAVVTGASTGIGREMAKILAAQGAHLIVVARNAEQLRSLKAEIKSASPSSQVELLSMDLSQAGSAQKLYEEVLKLTPQIHIFINNAGVGNFGAFLSIPLDTLRATHHLNTTSLLELTYLFLHHMKEHKERAYLLNVSSVVGHFSVPYIAHYCATKHFVQHLTLNIAAELGASNISVTILMPGKTKTDFSRRAQERPTLATKGEGMEASVVAQQAITGMLQGKAVVVNGLGNKILCLAVTFIPQILISKFSMKILRRTLPS